MQVVLRAVAVASCLFALTGIFSVCSAQDSDRLDETAPAAPSAGIVNVPALDAMLTKNDFNSIAQAIGRIPANQRADWLRDRLMGGGSIFLAFPYITALWQSGEAQKIADPKLDQRVTAGLILFYAYQVVVVEGLRCEDQSAPANRKMQLLTGFRPVF